MKTNKMWTKPRELEEAFFDLNSDLIPIREDIMQACTEINLAFSFQKKLLVCASGGSEADASRIVCDFMKGFMLPRPLSEEQKALFASAYGKEGEQIADKLQSPLRAISLSYQSCLNSTLGEDMDPALALAQAALGLTDEGDVFLGLCTSANSKDIAAAMMVAKLQGAKCIALTGADGGSLKDIADITILAPSNEDSKIQEYHLPIYRFLATFVEANFFG